MSPGSNGGNEVSGKVEVVEVLNHQKTMVPEKRTAPEQEQEEEEGKALLSKNKSVYLYFYFIQILIFPLSAEMS